MASISKQPNGRRTIQFAWSKYERRSIRLGKVSQRYAEGIKFRVEQLNAARVSGQGLEPDTARWVAELDDLLAEKLARAGLIAGRTPSEASTLGPVVRAYIDRRIDVKPATKTVWDRVAQNLIDHFGDDCELASINEGHAEDFKLYLIKDDLAPTTIQKRLQVVRQIFRDAQRRQLITSNPFMDVAAKAVIRQDRQRFITREETEQILAKCDPTWRVIVALSRYGGLRCPSEVLSLRWDGIDWERSRMTVESPKTEHHPGRARRVIPLFPELLPILRDAQEIAPDGAEFVVGGGYREAALTPKGWKNCNLRTQFQRIIKRAGLDPWPRLFHNLRASRETELAAQHPLHVVTSWLGNTPKIAMKHYLQVTEIDFEKAAITTCEIGGAKSGAEAVQKAVQHTRTPSRTDTQETNVAPDAAGAYAVVPTTYVEFPVAGTGFEPATSRL